MKKIGAACTGGARLEKQQGWQPPSFLWLLHLPWICELAAHRQAPIISPPKWTTLARATTHATGFADSASVALTRCLCSRLQARLSLLGQKDREGLQQACCPFVFTCLRADFFHWFRKIQARVHMNWRGEHHARDHTTNAGQCVALEGRAGRCRVLLTRCMLTCSVFLLRISFCYAKWQN